MGTIHLVCASMLLTISVHGCPSGFISIKKDLCAGLSIHGSQNKALQNCYSLSDRYGLTLWQLMMTNYSLFYDVYYNLLLPNNIEEIWMEMLSYSENGMFIVNSNVINETFINGYKIPVYNLNLTSDDWEEGSCLTWNVHKMTYKPRSCNENFLMVCLAKKSFFQRHDSSLCPSGYTMAPRHAPFCFSINITDNVRWTWEQAAHECMLMDQNSHIIQKSFPAVYSDITYDPSIYCPLGIRRIIEHAQSSDIYVWSHDPSHVDINNQVESYYMEYLDGQSDSEDDTFGILHYVDNYMYQEYPYGHRWSVTNGTATFNCLACETPAHVPHGKPKLKLLMISSDAEENGSNKVQMQLHIKNKLLFVNSNDEPQILCYFDSWLVKVFALTSQTEWSFTAEEEGYYWCIGYDLFTLTPVSSNKVLVIFPGHTMVAMLEVIEPTVTCDSLIHSFFNKETENENIFKSLHHLAGDGATVTLKRVTYNCSNILLHVKPNSDDFDLEKIFQINDYTFRTVFIRSRTFCLAEQHWNKSFIGDKIRYSDSKLITSRKCEGDFTTGAHWGRVSWSFKDSHLMVSSSHAYEDSTTLPMSSTENDDSSFTDTWISNLREAEITSKHFPEDIYNATRDQQSTSSISESLSEYTEVKSPSYSVFTSSPAVEPVNSSHFSEVISEHSSTFLSSTPILPFNKIRLSSSEVVYTAEAFHGFCKKHVNRSKLEEAVNLLNDLLDSDLSVLREQPSEKNLLQDVDMLLEKVSLESEHIMIVKPKVAIYVHDIKHETPYGLALTTTDPSDKNLNGELISLKSLDKTKDQNIDILIQFPELTSDARVSVAVFSDDAAFHDVEKSGSEITNNIVNSRIVSISINESECVNNCYIDILFRPLENANGTKACAFWKFDVGILGSWSTEGCEFINKSIDGLDICRCNHLTHFAEIISIKIPDLSEAHQFALDIISAVGCTLSLFGFLGIIITACIFPQWRRQTGNQILLSISASVALNMIFFLLIAVGVSDDQDSSFCIIIGTCLHYTLLTSFFWMFVAAILQYIRLVKVIGGPSTSYLLLKASLFSWGLPLIPIIILLSIDPKIYSAINNEGETRKFCFPNGIPFYTAVVGPVILIVFVNIVIFFAIMFNIYDCGRNRSIRRHVYYSKTYTVRRLIMGVLLFFLFGLTWISGFLSSVIFFTYVFCLTATLQGIILFVFFVFIESKTRRMWFPKKETSSQNNRTQSSSDATGVFNTPEEVTPLRNNFRSSSRRGNIPMSQRAEITEW